MATEIELELGGCVNGAPVDLKGRASLDLSEGVLQVGLTSRAAPLHWDPVLGLLGLLDAALVLAVAEAGGHPLPDVVHLRRRADLHDEHGRELGHEALSVAIRERSCRAQYISARMRMEPSERATTIEAMSPAILQPTGRGSLMLAGAVGFDSDWGSTYRVASLTTAELYGSDGPPSGSLAVGLSFGQLVRAAAALSLTVGVVVRELQPAGPSKRS